jgi:hypothetical protein
MKRFPTPGIVSGCGLDDGVIRGSIHGRGEMIFLITSVQTGYGAHPVSCTMGTGCPFHGGKARPGREPDHEPPSSKRNNHFLHTV